MRELLCASIGHDYDEGPDGEIATKSLTRPRLLLEIVKAGDGQYSGYITAATGPTTHEVIEFSLKEFDGLYRGLLRDLNIDFVCKKEASDS
jgi:hypothetical protein